MEIGLTQKKKTWRTCPTELQQQQEPNGKQCLKLGVLALALAVVFDATVLPAVVSYYAPVAPVAQHELIRWHDIPFEQPSCLQFKSVVLFIQATGQ